MFMHPDEIRSCVAKLKWYHSIDLGNGIITPGRYGPFNETKRMKWLKFPESLSGKTVLDVGAYDGFFSFEAERRGASRVLATDSYAWSEINEWNSKRSFNLAKASLGSAVDDLIIEVLDLSPDKIGMFDIVLFLGVLYHMKHPLLALERVASVTREMIVIETAVDMLYCRRPAIAFYPGSELGNDSTNWYGPNPKAVVGMLRTVGFSRIEIVSGVLPFWVRFACAAKDTWKRGAPFWSAARSSRIAIHAWK